MSTVRENGLLHRTHALGLTLEELNRWVDGAHVFPVDETEQARLRQGIDDLEGRVRHLEAEPALLTVVLVGGTGVGKSTLLNALAGARIADAGLARPTTRTPTVYHHADARLERIDPIFAQCRAAVHERPELRYKVLVDTPDIDGNVLEHRERLRAVLPVADAVLYVGSQEKYHDQEAWKLLLELRGSRGFAFILNKWDRCLASRRESTGQPPDEDFRHSLKEAGFEHPLVFRTCAAQWAARRLTESAASEPADDFRRLERWLDAGLDSRAIQEIKSRGITGRLEELVVALERLIPPAWEGRRDRLRKTWEQALREAIAAQATGLVEAADQQAAAFERHFSRIGRSNFGGVFGIYLKAVDLLAKLSVSVVPSLERLGEPSMEDLAARAVASIPAETHETCQRTLHARLLALADHEHWPILALDPYLPGTTTGRLDDRKLAETLSSELVALENDLAAPTGGKMATRIAIRKACEWGPVVVAVLLGCKWLWDHVSGTFWGMAQYFAVLALWGLSFAILHFLLSRLVPVRWEFLRGRFRRMVEDRLLAYIAPAYFRGLDAFSERVASERRTVVQALDILRKLCAQLKTAEYEGPGADLFPRQID